MELLCMADWRASLALSSAGLSDLVRQSGASLASISLVPRKRPVASSGNSKESQSKESQSSNRLGCVDFFYCLAEASYACCQHFSLSGMGKLSVV